VILGGEVNDQACLTRQEAGRRLLWVTIGPFYPDTAGGADHNYLYLFDRLRERGWHVEAICALAPGSARYRALRRRRPLSPQRTLPRFVLDEDLGYPCWRGPRGRKHARCWARWAISTAVRLARSSRHGPNLLRGCAPAWSSLYCSAELDPIRAWFDQRLRDYRPDVVLGHIGVLELLSAAARLGYPAFHWSQGTRHARRGGRYPAGVHVIANSPYVASLVAPVSPHEVGVVLSFMERARYEVRARERRYVTLVNPIAEKGVRVAIEVARRLPGQRFLFVRGGWFAHDGGLVNRLLRRPLASLPNVEVWDYQEDMRRVYAVTDILLVPSRRESFGRVIVEAQMSGIPVVAANEGGIPFALGEGGILVDPGDDPGGYVDAVRQLRADDAHYATLSALALRNSRRPEFDPALQVERFIDFVERRLPSGSDRP
jgi:glycosyltransferase involved in cell wall biosynthesis